MDRWRQINRIAFHLTARLLPAYKRWSIEVFFRNCKQKLAFDKCQLRKQRGIERMWLLLSLVHFLCCTLPDYRGAFEKGFAYFRECLLQAQGELQRYAQRKVWMLFGICSFIVIMKEFRNKGLAQKAFEEVEKIHGHDNWKLDTILQEEGNCYLYEKLGYKRTGLVENINDKMDIVYYEKN